jgi:hypothetical protein
VSFHNSRFPGGELAALVIGALIYAGAIVQLKDKPRDEVTVELATALPRFIQVAMSGGDRFLAANINVFRALVAATERMNRENFRVQGILQRDAAWLNPAHEDNYYIAAAILAWNNEVAAADDVLRSAEHARPFDPLPPFYLAFDHYHFHKRSQEAISLMRIAAARSPDIKQRQAFEYIAARWTERREDTEVAIAMLRAMLVDAPTRRFRKHLELRIQRLEGVAALETAVGRYATTHGGRPASLDQLIVAGLIDAVPRDPLGGHYALDGGGNVLVIEKGKK